MSLRHLAVIPIVLACVIGVGARQTGGKGTRSAEAQPASTPGQLTIVDKQGKPAGMCPLKHTSVTADIAGYVARVTVTQEFANPGSTPIEAIYTFPLPEDAAVDDMTMVIGSRTVKGRILRREEARQVYEAAKAAGQAAALLDQERPNIFTQSVANIMPGDKVSITISYVNLLKYEEGQYEFVFPMVVGPRYTPDGGYRAPGQRGAPSGRKEITEDPGSKSVVTDADKITPPITPPGTRAGHDISVTVNLDAGLPLTGVRAALHDVDVRQVSRSQAVVRLRNKDEIPNKDFILRYGAAGSDIQEGLLAYAPGGTSKGGYFTLIIQPPLAPPQKMISAKEMVFVIDQTGSQSGWPIAKSKETMAYCIQHLNPGDTFQLLGFNTKLFPCFPAPVPATPATIRTALDFLAPIEGAGGTDILKAADYALKLPDDPGRLRIVCYMTDGYVGNDMQIIDYVSKHRGRARMFPFGIGNGVNRFLIEGMAREGKGQAEYVTLNQPGKEAAERFYRRIASPLLLDVAVDWGGLAVEDVYPRNIPDVFSAKPIILRGRYTQAGEGDITVSGMLRGQPWSRVIHVVFPAVHPEGSAIATLWARERIEDLQNQDWVGAQTNHPKPDIKEQVIATALEYRLMSQYTSFVAVEEKVVNVGGQQQTVDVPVEMPEGVSYQGIFGTQTEAERLMAPGSAAATGMSANFRAAAVPSLRQSPGPAMGMGGPGGGGGLGGGYGGIAGKPATKGRTLFSTGRFADAGDAYDYDNEIARGTPEGRKRLAELKPAERVRALAIVKLAPTLRDLPERLKQSKTPGSLDVPGAPKVRSGRVQVQIWLNDLPPDGLAKLKALGFQLDATLLPSRLLLGTVAVDKLGALIELPMVWRVEPPRLK